METIKLDENKNIKLGIMISYVGMFVSLIGTIFVSNKILNYVGDYNYGLYAFVNSITSWLTVLSSALNASYLRYATLDSKSNDNHEPKKVNTIYLKLFIIICFFIFVISFFVIIFLYKKHICISEYSWNDSKMMYMLSVVFILNIVITLSTSIYSLFINYKERFIFKNLITLLINIFGLIGNYLIAYYTHSIFLIAIFSLFRTIISFIFNYIFSKRIGISFEKVALKDNKPFVKSIILFSSILVFNSIVDQINTNVDKTLLGFFSIPESIAIYQMGQQFNTYMMYMSTSVSGVFAPKIYVLVSKKDNEGLSNLYLKISKIQTIILCMIVFGFMACGKNFVIWWIGESRINAFYVGFILMLIGLCPLTMNSSIEIQRAENKHKFRAIVYFIAALFNIFLSILFLKIFPSEYAIFACLTGTIISTICSHWIFMNIYNEKEIHLPVKKYMFNLLCYMLIGLSCALFASIIANSFLADISSVLIKFIVQGLFFVLLYGFAVIICNKSFILNYLRNKTL